MPGCSQRATGTQGDQSLELKFCHKPTVKSKNPHPSDPRQANVHPLVEKVKHKSPLAGSDRIVSSTQDHINGALHSVLRRGSLCEIEYTPNYCTRLRSKLHERGLRRGERVLYANMFKEKSYKTGL